jgi:Chaperone of endosialidase
VLGNAGEANTIRIGKQGTQKSTLIAGIFGTAVTGSSVVVSSTGKLGVATSSARFKEAIKPMDKASEALLELKPVTFRYKEELDPDKIPQFGLIAEDVEKVSPDLVVRDEDGKVPTVRYEAVNAMLLNEFLKEHRKATAEQCKVQEQGRTIQELIGLVRNQQKQIEKLTAGLQQVSVEVELAKPSPKTVANH